MAFNGEQLKNAAIIMQVGRSMGASTRDIQIALMAALVESNLINVNYGDRDSLGLFQQRPSQGWGTPEQVTNPAYAAGQFFSHLLKVKNRYGMSMGAAAQAVQRSAYPDRYDQRLGEVRKLWPAIQWNSGEQVQDMDGQPYDVAANTGQATVPAGTGIPDQHTVLSVSTPDAKTMLGAWGANSPQPAAPVEMNVNDGTQSLLSQITNTQVIEPLQVANQNYAKGVDGWRKAVLDAARSALGTPYTWGGNSLSSGVDCSGLVQQAFARAGIDLPRVSYAQASSGARVGYGGLLPGDLVAWDNSSRNNGADHIAIYIGNGQIIEAPRPGLAVRIRSIGKDLDGGWGVHINR
jgi:cell wall-associated NlpC family hydrolase